MLSKRDIKTWIRSGSWRFMQDAKAPYQANAELVRYNYQGKPIYYRPGSSDTTLIYEILLKQGRKAEYWVPDDINPEVILDMGGNVGTATVYFANRFPNAKIHTFEPVSENHALLVKNTEPYPQVSTYQVALDKADGSMEIHASDMHNNFGGFSFHSDTKDSVSTETVRVRNTAGFLAEQGIDKVDLIKIDTEGAEYNILTAMNPDMLKKVRWLVGELHSKRDFELLNYLQPWFDIDMKKSLGKSLYTFHACNRSLLPGISMR